MDMKSSTVTVDTGVCLFCGKRGEVHNVPLDGYLDWQSGQFIQNALPQLSAGDREQLLNGTHDACFKAMFPEEDEED